MDNKCNRCGSGIPTISLSAKQWIEFLSLIRKNKIQAVKKMIVYGLSHADAKRIVSHFNIQWNTCHRCGDEKLRGERVTCNNCQSFNYNLEILKSFNPHPK